MTGMVIAIAGAAAVAGGVLAYLVLEGLSRLTGRGPRRELGRCRRLLNTVILIRRKGERLFGPVTLEDLALMIRFGESEDLLMGVDRWSMHGAYDLINRDDWKGWPEP